MGERLAQTFSNAIDRQRAEQERQGRIASLVTKGMAYARNVLNRSRRFQ